MFWYYTWKGRTKRQTGYHCIWNALTVAEVTVCHLKTFQTGIAPTQLTYVLQYTSFSNQNAFPLVSVSVSEYVLLTFKNVFLLKTNSF